jgi:HK97 gp10 family phage protein
MASPVEVKVVGLEELQKKLQDQLPQKAKAAIRAALRDGAKVIQAAIVDEAPKDSGLLSEHIDIKTRVRGGGLTGSAFVGPSAKVTYPTSDNPRLGKGPRAKPAWLVAKFLEFGTVRMGANPFMTRAFESNKSKATDAVIARLREIFGL